MSGFPYPVPPELLEVLGAGRRYWLATHEHPDNDGFGSMLALGLALEAMGREVAMLHEGDGPDNLRHLPGSDRTRSASELEGEADVVVLFDCHRLERTGAAASRLGGYRKLIVIDHHPVGEEGCEGDVCWVVEKAAATAVLVHSLLLALDGVGIDPDRATCLYAALVTDTGGFRFDNTGEEAFVAAAQLVGSGADPAEIAERHLYHRRPQALRLMSAALDGVQYRLGGRVGFMRVTQEMLGRTGAELNETEGFINLLGSTDGIRLVALLKEGEDGTWRVSLRANAPHRVDAIARALGGGGHARAAAFRSRDGLDSLENELLQRFGAELERGGRAP